MEYFIIFSFICCVLFVSFCVGENIKIKQEINKVNAETIEIVESLNLLNDSIISLANSMNTIMEATKVRNETYDKAFRDLNTSVVDMAKDYTYFKKEVKDFIEQLSKSLFGDTNNNQGSPIGSNRKPN